MDNFGYIFLLFLMLYVLYVSGKALRESQNLLSVAGISAIVVYTFNEGLRFGRGIDYNLYGNDYENFARTGDSGQNFGFMFVEKCLITLDMPWQVCVCLMSFTFILGTLYLLKKQFLSVLPYALPFFVLLSMSRVENMVRWYFGFSFIMAGLSYQIIGNKKIEKEFVLFSILGCTIHYALLPIPFLLYLFSLNKKTIMHPLISIPLFFIIALSFQTSIMMEVSNIANILFSVSEKFEHYGDDVEYWLTGGFAGADRTVFPGISELLFLCVLTYAGYKPCRTLGGAYLYAYNLYLIGFITLPIARQIELFSRFNAIFYFFGAIVFAVIIEYGYIRKTISFGTPIIYLGVLLTFLNFGRVKISEPLYGNPDFYLYVWNKGNRTYDEMYHIMISNLVYGTSKVTKNSE